MTIAPAGWYADPTGRHERRYWNGTAWTEHVWSAGKQSIDQLAPTPEAGHGQREDRLESTDTTEITSTQAKGATSTNAVEPVPAKEPSPREAKRRSRDEFESVALAAAHGDLNALRNLPAAMERAATLSSDRSLERKKWKVLRRAIRNVLKDDQLSEEENQHLFSLSTALGLDLQQLAKRDRDLFEEFVIANINDGRFPRTDVPIALKVGEEGCASFKAQLMKEVTLREMRGSSSGFSVRLAKGVTFRTGQMRARSVVLGTELQVEDVGLLVVTNQRAVFAGRTRTLEFRFDKLVGMEQFRDGLRLNVSNRQHASLFKITPPSSPFIAGALIAHSL